jgi:hypothetical protein
MLNASIMAGQTTGKIRRHGVVEAFYSLCVRWKLQIDSNANERSAHLPLSKVTSVERSRGIGIFLRARLAEV